MLVRFITSAIPSNRYEVVIAFNVKIILKNQMPLLVLMLLVVRPPDRTISRRLYNHAFEN